jgi:glutathione synthase/RimK-type ligase-like ATP-grasp enzyme
MMKLYAYKNGSASARALADALGIKILLHEGKPIRNQTIINWGSSNIVRPFDGNLRILNKDYAVAKASNKLTTFKLFKEHGVACPEWTESRDEAWEWLDKSSVVARKVLNGHSGAGIEIIEQGAKEICHAPLYTKYVKKDQEYRIHVFQGEVLFQQRKARKIEVPDEEVNWQVRNLAGGFIFANDGVVAPENVQQQAIKAVEALGLDFGAVDVLTTKRGEAYCLEVNTACGVQGRTLEAYVQAFKKFM